MLGAWGGHLGEWDGVDVRRGGVVKWNSCAGSQISSVDDMCLPLLYGVGEFDAEVFKPLRAPSGAGAMARSATWGDAVRDIGRREMS